MTGDFLLQNECQQLRKEIEGQQAEIDKGNTIATKLGPALMQDMARVAIKNEPMRDLLAKHGYRVLGPPAHGAPPPAAKEIPAPAAKAETPVPPPKVEPPAPPKAESTPRGLQELLTDLASSDWNAETEKKWTAQVAELEQQKATRDSLVTKSMEVQGKLEQICQDLLILAKSDEEAAQVVKKYNIKKAGDASAQ